MLYGELRRTILLASMAGLPLAAEASHIFVPGDFPSLQVAIDNADHGDTIWVQPGLLDGPDNRALDLGVLENLTIRGNGLPSQCVIDCEHQDRFIEILEEHQTVTLKDLTIFNGSSVNGGSVYVGPQGVAEIESVRIINSSAVLRGGAAYFSRWSTVSLVDVDFSGNDAAEGGAIVINSADVTIEDSTIEANDAERGGAIYMYRGAPQNAPTLLVQDTTVQGNAATDAGGGIWSSEAEDLWLIGSNIMQNDAGGDGGAVASYDSRLEVNDCWVFSNVATRAGALYVEGDIAKLLRTDFEKNQAPNSSAVRLVDVNARADNVRFLENSGGSTVGMFSSASAIIANAVFWSNDSQYQGAGVYVGDGSDLELASLTLTLNHSDASNGAGVYVSESSSAVVTNSILWENDADGAMGFTDQVDGFGAITIQWSCIQDLDPAAYPGSVAVDPAFEDAPGNDVHLAYGSPLVNAGNHLYRPQDWCDLDGDFNPLEPLSLDLDDTERVKFGEIDMGAYESSQHPGDFNGDGVLSILDFLAFQQAFQNQDEAADLNGDGEFSILDFVIFQQLFQS